MMICKFDVPPPPRSSNKYQPMKSKTTSFSNFSTFTIFCLLLTFVSTHSLFAQSILPQKLEFPQICANIPNAQYPLGFNRFNVPFKISGFAANETFIVLLSDDKGSFSNPIKPKIIDTPVDTPTDKTLTFEVPADLIGSDIYKIRVQNSTGTTISGDFKASDLSTSFPIYFLSYSGQFYINNKSNTLSFCSGGSVTLNIDNPTPLVPNTSPLQYPQLKYKWYKDGNVIPNENNNSLSINQEGDYYVEINYGPCTDVNTHSQIVKVSGASGAGNATITSSLGNSLCSNSENTTLTVTAANSYVWKKDGVIIPQATNQTYQTNAVGLYTCDVDFGGCKATGTIDLQMVGTVNANGNVVAEDETVPINQGETVTVTTTTNVSSPTYQWYYNDVSISGATQSALDITLSGNYKVVISGCTMTFKVSYSTLIDYNVPKISNIISPNNDGTNDTWIIPDEYTDIDNPAQVVILNSLGEIVFETNKGVNEVYHNDWPQSSIDFKNFNPVFYYIITPTGGSAKKGSITVLK